MTVHKVEEEEQLAVHEKHQGGPRQSCNEDSSKIFWGHCKESKNVQGWEPVSIDNYIKQPTPN